MVDRCLWPCRAPPTAEGDDQSEQTSETKSLRMVSPPWFTLLDRTSKSRTRSIGGSTTITG